jgi:hypothetical protein
LSIGRETEITKVQDDQSIPVSSYTFVAIADVPEFVKGRVDIAGLVLHEGDAVEITSKTGKELVKKDVVVYD